MGPALTHGSMVGPLLPIRFQFGASRNSNMNPAAPSVMVDAPRLLGECRAVGFGLPLDGGCTPWVDLMMSSTGTSANGPVDDDLGGFWTALERYCFTRSSLCAPRPISGH